MKIETRGSIDMLQKWRKGDIGMVWLEGYKCPSALFTIGDVAPRNDLIGTIEAYEHDHSRPHTVKLENSNTIVCFFIY